jgi:hypothetical protein
MVCHWNPFCSPVDKIQLLLQPYPLFREVSSLPLGLVWKFSTVVFLFFFVLLEVGGVMVSERHRWQAVHCHVAFVLSLLLTTIFAS